MVFHLQIERFIIKYGSDLNNNQVEQIAKKVKNLHKSLEITFKI